MKSLKLLYPHHSVVNLLKKLLKTKKYDILTIDEKEGAINAVKKRRFQKDLILNIKVSKVDNNITNLDLTLNLKGRLSNNKLLNAEDEEERLINSVDNYF